MHYRDFKSKQTLIYWEHPWWCHTESSLWCHSFTTPFFFLLEGDLWLLPRAHTDATRTWQRSQYDIKVDNYTKVGNHAWWWLVLLATTTNYTPFRRFDRNILINIVNKNNANTIIIRFEALMKHKLCAASYHSGPDLYLLLRFVSTRGVWKATPRQPEVGHEAFRAELGKLEAN